MEVLLFEAPLADENNLCVKNAPCDLDVEDIFGRFGLVYEVQVVSYNIPGIGAPQTSTVTYVKYYSAQDARAALTALRKTTICGRTIQVSRVKRSCAPAPFALPLFKCIDLANHFFGFNGWSCEVVEASTYRLNGPRHQPHYECQCSVRVFVAGFDGCAQGTGAVTTMHAAKCIGESSPGIPTLVRYARRAAASLASQRAFGCIAIVRRTSHPVSVRFFDRAVSHHPAPDGECPAL